MIFLGINFDLKVASDTSALLSASLPSSDYRQNRFAHLISSKTFFQATLF